MTMYFEPFTFTLEQLTNFMENEFRILSMDTKSALDSLRKELQMVESYLMDVDEIERRASVSHVLSSHLQHLREIALDVEDLLDTFLQEAQDRGKGSLWKRLKAVFSPSNPLVRTHQVIERVERLKQQLKETLSRPKGYQLPTNLLPKPNCGRRRPRTYPYTNNDNEFIVGLEEDTRSLVAKLVGREGDHATTLAIVGTGGSGKTTLARKLYNHKEIAERFPSRAWVCVSQEWSTTHLLCEICVQVGVRLQPGGETSIPFHKLHEFLKHRSYFIVLDDVWRVEALQELLPILLSSRSTSSGRVLITTRNRKVISFPRLGGLHIHEARYLTVDESWELFSTIICSNWEGVCSFEGEVSFARLGNKMLEKCNGLPLAVVTLAGLLSTKGTIQEWECVNNDVMSRIRKHDKGSHDYGAMEEMLQLCYVDLPYHLKPCFLYLGIFQEDDHTCVEQLIQLWIAEGFVKHNLCNENETLEELARDFLDELVQRCLVQVDGRDYEGKVQYVRIHDLMRDLCITKAKDLSFFEISSSSILDPSSMKPRSHRTIIHKGKSFSTYNQRLRSFICPENHGGGMTKLELPYETMKLLRVLHLVKVDLGDSAEAIGNLTLLRYLRIERCCGINELVQSTATLKSLLTFVYSVNDGQTLPNNMVCSMEQLRHLSLSCDYTNAGQALGVDKSRNLQVLRAVAGEWIAKELCFLTIGLQELHLTAVHSQAQLEAISNFVSSPNSHLHTLHASLLEAPRLEFHLEKLKLGRLRLLKRLVLWGKTRKQRSPLVFPPNLLSLELRFTKIEKEDDLRQALAHLDHLRHLVLGNEAYKGSELSMIGLPQLQELTISNMSNLKEWRVENGGLSQLKKLSILNCYELERIPEGIGYMSNLQSFRACFVSKSFCKRLQRPFGKDDIGEDGDEGEDFHLIQHIPLVEIRSMHVFHTKKTCSV